MPQKTLRTITPEGLRSRYVIALSIVALLIIGSQYVIQSSIKRQKGDSHVVNIAGRQRMLSQNITKTALYIYGEKDQDKVLRQREQLLRSLSLWTASHRGLRSGDPATGLPGGNSQTVNRLYDEIQQNHDKMVSAVNRILRITADPSYDPADLLRSLRQLELHEGPFLEGMNEIVDQYDAEARQKIDRIRITEYALGLLTLLTLTAEALLIFRPAGLSLRHTLGRLKRNERDLKKLFDVSPSGMLLVRAADLTIIRLSESAARLIGAPVQQCLGRALPDFIDAGKLAVLSGLNADGQTSAEGIDVTFSGDRGEEFHVIMSASCITYRNELAYVVGLSDISERVRYQELLNRLATTDGMTGLLNRRTGLEILRKEVEQVKRGGKPLAIAFIDLNELKAVNDGLSHEEGDWMIISFAEAIGAAVRASDSAVRYGGDEFLVVFPDCSYEAAEEVMLRVESLIADAAATENKPYHMSFSYGLIECTAATPLSAEELVSSADQAMYEMKRLSKLDKPDAIGRV